MVAWLDTSASATACRSRSSTTGSSIPKTLDPSTDMNGAQESLVHKPIGLDGSTTGTDAPPRAGPRDGSAPAELRRHVT